MSGAPDGLVCELMTQSLAAWRLAGSVEPTSDGAIVIGVEKDISIEPAPPDSMFRWMVTIGGRTRPALSVVGRACARSAKRSIPITRPTGSASRSRRWCWNDRRGPHPGFGAHRLSRQRQDHDARSSAASAGILAHRRHHQRIRRNRARSRADRNQRGQLHRAHDRMPVLQNPHRPDANTTRPAAPARRGQLLTVRSRRDRNQRTCRPGADPPRLDDGCNHRRPPRAWRRGDDGRCRERRRHARTRSDFAKAGCGRRPYCSEQAGSDGGCGAGAARLAYRA